MTREEKAIRELKILKNDYWDDDGYGHETQQCNDTMLALDRAIKALEQEPCEDCISRREAIKMFTYNYKGERIPDYDCDNFPVQIAMKTVKEILRELPPVNPQPNTEDIYREREQAYMRGFEDGSRKYRTEQSEDAISRQAVLDLMQLKMGGRELYKAVYDLPPVNPQPKTGHWIYDNSLFNWRCSECNETPKTMGYVGTADFMTEHFKFCNHCGAKMIEPQESEVEE